MNFTGGGAAALVNCCHGVTSLHIIIIIIYLFIKTMKLTVNNVTIELDIKAQQSAPTTAKR